MLIGYGAAAVNPYLAFESVEDLITTGALPGVDAGHRDAQLRQGARQGRPEDHVQDGHLHRLVVPRRPGLRGGRPRRELVERYFTGTASRIGGIGLAEIPPRWPPATPAPARRNPAERAHRAWRSAASTSGAARASCTCSTRRRSSCCSTPPAAGSTTSSAVHRHGGRAGRAGRFAARAVPSCVPGAPAGADRRGRAGQRDRQALLHRRDVLRLDLGGGARDPRHRDEPARRQVQHRRGRRGRRAAARPARGARRSSRSPAAGSG